MHRFRLLPFAFILLSCCAADPVADPGSFLGINCGKSGAHDTKQGMRQYFLRRNVATLNLARQLGLGWARCGGGPEQWYVGGKPSPERFETVIHHANQLGIRVYLYIEYRGDINRERISDFDWHAVGRAFARHYGERISCFGILNEVDHVASPHTPAEVARAVGAFADGVHSVSQRLLVSTPAIGGTPMEIARADAFLQALAPLINGGRVNVLNLHSYHDSRPHKPHFSNLDHSSKWAPSRNFLRAKAAGGITGPVRFMAGEFNYRNWDGEDDARARGFMTALWDQLMVVAAAGSEERVGLFSAPYNIPDTRPGRQTTMARRFDWREDGSFDYEPNEKGRVLAECVRLTRGTRFIHCDPHDTGVAILKGNGRKVWVWQNRGAFSSLADARRIVISGIPEDAQSLSVRGHANLTGPARSIPLTGAGRVQLNIADLPADQTLLFIADGDGPAKRGGIAAIR